MSLQRTGGIAALIGVGLSILSLVIGVSLLAATGGQDVRALADSAAFQTLAQQQGLLFSAEVLKLVTAAVALVVVLALRARLHARAPGLVQLATLAGVVAAALLLAAGLVGLYSVSLLTGGNQANAQSGATVAGVVNNLGFASVAVNGLWYLLASVVVLRAGGLPRGLAFVGVPLGALSLVTFALPPLAFLVLLLSLVWGIWLGVVLLRGGTAPHTAAPAYN